MKRDNFFILLFVLGSLFSFPLYAQQGSMDWTQATDSAQWTGRNQHSSVVFNNMLWVLGGNATDVTRKNDVWYSTDGTNWILATDSAEWTPRYNHASVVFDNKIWVLGGYNRTNDVWYSSNGVNWTRATNAAGWSRRDGHAVVVFDNKMWVLGGMTVSTGRMNDVWYSTDGINWTLATDSAGWSKRDEHTAVVFDNKMWVIGGYATSGGRQNDVWYSTDGVNWTEATDAAGWSRRDGHAVVVFDNKMWILGGYSTRKNDVWYSSDGANWTQATNTAGWSKRHLHTANTFDNRIWVMGGNASNGNRKNDVWYSRGFAATLISPYGGETLVGGSTQTIKWRTNITGFTHFSLLFSSDTSMNYSDTIANNILPSETTYQWTVPYINSKQCRVMVQVVDEDSVRIQDASDKNFIIRTISIVTPNGDEFWQGGSNKMIQWRKYADISFSYYRLLLSSDGGVSFPDTIANNVAPTESTFIWTLPSINSNLCRVKVQMINASDSVISSDESDMDFTIDSDPPGAFSLLLPLNNGWTGRNPRFIWQPAFDNFGTSYYQLAIAIPNETIQTNCYTNYYYASEDSNWAQVTDSAEWTGRYGHTSVVFDNKMWVLGGQDENDYRNDVWFSINGANWTQASASASWAPRYNHTSVVFDNKIWVLGGYDYNNDNELNDIWYSIDGVNWIQATDSAEWSPREGHTSLVYDNKIWVIGGFNNNGDFLNDVWYSSDGVNWTQATGSAEWLPRYRHTSFVYDNKVWVIGGEDGTYQDDVWYSSDGVNWICATDSATWSQRLNHTSFVFDNKMWVVGGDDGYDLKNDVWYSSDGTNWVCATSSASWEPREGHTSVVFDNKMWVVGGYGVNNLLNDVWYSSLPLHLTEEPHNWWVIAFDRAGNSRQSNEIFSVRVDTGLPITPILISPNDSTIIGDSFVTFVWYHSIDSLSGVIAYRLWVANNPEFSPSVDTIVSDTLVTLVLSDTTYWWRVCAIDSANNKSDWTETRNFRVLTSGIEENQGSPAILYLSLSIYPNPIKSSATIRYTIPNKSRISLLLYDAVGRLVKSFENGERNRGVYRVNLSSTELSAGVYFAALRSEQKKVIIKRIVVAK